MKIVAKLLILIGILVIAYGTWRLSESIRWISVAMYRDEPLYSLDGPPFLSFENYGTAPIAALAYILAGVTILKKWWRALSLIFSAFLSASVAEWIWFLFLFGWGALKIWTTIATMLVWSGGVALSEIAWRRNACGTSPPSTTNVAKPFSPEVVLAAIAASSYLGHAAIFSLSREAAWAANYLRGVEHTFGGQDYIVVYSVVGLGAAIAVATGIVNALRGKFWAMDAALAFMAGLSLSGFLILMDMAVAWRLFSYWDYRSLQAAAFAACVLALTVRARRGLSRKPTQPFTTAPA